MHGVCFINSLYLQVWIDLKGKVKRIISENNAEFRATGGGPCNITMLTPLQEDVDAILQISAGLNLTGNVFGCGPCESLEENVETVEDSSLPLIVLPDNEPSAVTPPGESLSQRLTALSQRRGRNGGDNARLELLKKQVDHQEKIVESYKKIEKNTYKIGKQLEKLVELKKEKLEMKKKALEEGRIERLEERKLKLQKLELKKKELELKRRKLDLADSQN